MSAALTFTIPDMSCASCVGRIEAALNKLDGVKQVRANLARGTVSLEGDADLTSPAIMALDAAGYPAQTQRLSFTVEGLSCASCVGRLETALEAVPGVVSAHVNLARATASVTGLAGKDLDATLMQVARAAGYPLQHRGADKQQANTQDDLRHQVLLAFLLGLPVFILEMGGHLFPAFHHWIGANIGHDSSRLIQFILTTGLLAGPGRVFFAKGMPSLMRRAPDMNALVALGAGAAWAYSTLVTFAPSVLPEQSRAVYFESAALIAALILLGRLLEARAKGRTGAAIEALMALQPDTARVVTAAGIEDRPIAEITPGTRIQIPPGAQIPVDGTVLEGQSYVDEAMLTGEPEPALKTASAAITGGTINGTGTLLVEARAVGADSVLAGIVEMVEQAQSARLPVQDLVNRITAVFVPIVLIIAFGTVVIWLLLGPSLAHALVAGVSVLIIACPCAMGLATPSAIVAGTGRAATRSVLFRKGEALQRLADIRLVVFDKTGTLTQGHPEVVNVALFGGTTRGDLLRLSAAVEQSSEHPIARAILAAHQGALVAVSEFDAIPGHGARGTVETRAVLIGNHRLMASQNIAFEPQERRGQTAIYVAIDGQAAGVIFVSDPIKPSSAGALAALRDLDVKVAMVTGDAAPSANAVAEALGIDITHCDVLPGEKAQIVRQLQDQYGATAFVGDGINDAPALSAADVGIALGTGTDIAIEAADVILMSGDLGGVPGAFDLSRKTMRVIRQNLFWAFSYNVLLIPVAAGLLYPALGLLLSPALAAGAMAASSLIVLTNALRLRKA